MILQSRDKISFEITKDNYNEVLDQAKMIQLKLQVIHPDVWDDFIEKIEQEIAGKSFKSCNLSIYIYSDTDLEFDLSFVPLDNL